MTEWETVALQDVATIDRDVIEASAIEDGTLYVGLENIQSGGDFVDVRAVDSGELASSKFAFTPRHLLYGKLRPYLAKIARPQFDGICSTDILPVLPGPNLDRDYLAHFLLQPNMVAFANSRATGANLPRLSPRALVETKVPLPPLREQRRIAEVLDRAEALRAKRRVALTQLDTLTQSIFLDMFGDPGTNPKNWKLSPMAELFELPPIFGTMIPPSNGGGSWLSLRVANIQDWRLDLSDQKFVDLPVRTVDRHSVRNGDLLMARAIASQGHLGKAIVVKPGGRKWAFDSHLMRLRLDASKAEPEVVRHLLMTPGGRAMFLKATRRSAVQFNINTKEISTLAIPVPPISLQRNFARCIDAVESLRSVHRASLASLDALFASLQHRAFRGEL